MPDKPWPGHLVALERVFKAINTVYTFISIRTPGTVTYDRLKGPVENIIKRPLVQNDLAQIKSLLPDSVVFKYIENVNEDDRAPEPSRKRLKREEADDAYEKWALAASNDQPTTVLEFSFKDGQAGFVVTKNGVKGKNVKSLTPQLKASTSDITTIVNKRNAKFKAAINALIESHADPVASLLTAAIEHIPVNEVEHLLTARDAPQDLSMGEKVEDLKKQPFFVDQIVDNGYRLTPARNPQYATLDFSLPPLIWEALQATKHITQLYTHQAEAINALYSEERPNIIVSTPTSSGKSLIYQIPILKDWMEDNDATFMCMLPTKALAQDQLRSMRELLFACEIPGTKVATYDGDTPFTEREAIQENANIILTNPDTVHVSILPHEQHWRRFLQNLRLIILDEIHVYTGLFGTHVAYVMRRLQRLCKALGNHSVRVVSCSATLSNAVEHMQTLCHVTHVYHVSEDGAPSGAKHNIIWNPPFVDEMDKQVGRRSTITDCSSIVRFLISRGTRVIVFCRVRQLCEMVTNQIREDLLAEQRSDLADKIMAYRSGYTAEARRKIERDMFDNSLLAIVATTALELGIDIGSLDAAISLGFPYSLSNLRQQAGRAGRRQADSLFVYITDPYPVDQHFARHPEKIWDGDVGFTALDLSSEVVEEPHLQCAAQEVPVVVSEDEAYFEHCARLCGSHLVRDAEGYFHPNPRYLPNPAKWISLRAVEDVSYTLVDESTPGAPVAIEEIEHSRSIFSIYEGAVYMHQGRTFVVRHIDHERRIARICEARVDYRTRQRDFTDVDPVKSERIKEVAGGRCSALYGAVRITSVVFGYFKTDLHNKILDVVDVIVPPFIKNANGLWIDVPACGVDFLKQHEINVPASIHAACHALMSLTPYVTQGDVRTECKAAEKELTERTANNLRQRPHRLILYDACGTGGGFCMRLYERIDGLIEQAIEAIDTCPCDSGCPGCITSHACKENNSVLSKIGASVTLKAVLGQTLTITAGIRAATTVAAAPADAGERFEAEREGALNDIFGTT